MRETEFILPQGKIAALQSANDCSEYKLIALHGWLDNAASFIPLSQVAPELNISAVDLIGHGHSAHRPKFSHYHFIDWVSDLQQLIEHVGANQPVNLVGHSLGGMVASVFAGLYPEKVNSLVLIDAAGLVIQDDEQVVQNMRAALDSRQQLLHKTKRLHQTLNSAVRARMAAGKLSRTNAEILVSRNIQQTELGYEWRTDQRLKTGSPLRINHVAAEQILANIQCPVLVCLAEQGLDMVKKSYQRYAHCYNNSKKVTVEGGHHCHMDYPEQVAQQLRHFYRRHI